MGCSGSKEDPAVEDVTYAGGYNAAIDNPASRGSDYKPMVAMGKEDNEYGHEHFSSSSGSKTTSGTSSSKASRNVLASRNILPSENINAAVFRQVGGGGVDFRASLREAGDRLVLVKFYEDKCEDCEAMNKLYQEFVLKYPGVLFLEANVAHNKDAVAQLRVKFLPTFVAFKNHLEVGRLVNTQLEDIEDLVRKNI